MDIAIRKNWFGQLVGVVQGGPLQPMDYREMHRLRVTVFAVQMFQTGYVPGSMWYLLLRSISLRQKTKVNETHKQITRWKRRLLK